MISPDFLSLVVICLLGAMSPGPSLAVVALHSGRAGIIAGLACALCHGAGIFLWAMLTVSGLGSLLLLEPALFDATRACGALFLMYLGVRTLRSPSTVATNLDVSREIPTRLQAAGEGFLIALANPKIAIFFLALFSQYIQPHAPITDQLQFAATAAIIDAAWYCLVAVSISRAALLARFRSQGTLLNRCFGAILIGLSLTMLGTLWVD